jgi:peptidyl-prolyl cis-trans isomerase C
MKKLLKEPLLHFLILGGLIFALNTWRDAARPAKIESTHIEVTAAVIERLRAGYERQFGQAPDETELRRLVSAHIREEVLCREALALGLDRDDTIVRRRLAQKMEFLTDDLLDVADPDDATLQKFLTQNWGRYAKPARVSFQQVYFSREKRGMDAETAARDALNALEKGASEEAMGDAFLHGFEFAEREHDELIALFGPEFAKGLAAEPVGRWRGPVPSSYGVHLVYILERRAPQPVALGEVRAELIRDFNEERRRTANREVFEKLRERYQVAVDEAALTQAAADPIKTAAK